MQRTTALSNSGAGSAQWGAGRLGCLILLAASGCGASVRAGRLARLRVAGVRGGPLNDAARGRPRLDGNPSAEPSSSRLNGSRPAMQRASGGGHGSLSGGVRQRVRGGAPVAAAADGAEGGKQALSMLAQLLAGMQQPQEEEVPTGAHLAIHGLSFQPPGADLRCWLRVLISCEVSNPGLHRREP